MLIRQAMAQTTDMAGTVVTAEATETFETAAAGIPAPAGISPPPSPWEAFALNMLLILILVIMFYVLLIMPQQKRFKKHRAMLNQLKKGDEVVTAGGFIAKIDKIKEGDNEVLLDLGNGVKVTALRSAIQGRAKEA